VIVKRIYLGYSTMSLRRVIGAGVEKSRKKDHSHNEANGHYRLRLFKVDFVPIESRTSGNENAQPSQSQSDVRVQVYLLEQLWP
jgi:hypothetical protein